MCTFQSSKSFLWEIVDVFIATGVAPSASHHAPDATEFIELRAFPFDEAIRMVERSEIQDAISIVAILHAARRRGRATTR